MSNDYDEESADNKIIQTALDESAVALRKFNAARNAGTVSTRVQRNLADAALNLYDTLYQYRDETALEQPWDERGVEWLEEAAGTTVSTEQSLPRANGATTTTQRPKLLAVDPTRIRDALRELNDIAKELGFTPSARDKTPHEGGDLEDLQELLKGRGQNDAADRLPIGGN